MMKFLTVTKTIISDNDVHTIYNAICDNLEKANATVQNKSINEYISFTIKSENVWARDCLSTSSTISFLLEGTQTKLKFQFRLHRYLELFIKIFSALLFAIECVLAVFLIKSQLSMPAVLFLPVLMEAMILAIAICGLQLGARKSSKIATQGQESDPVVP